MIFFKFAFLQIEYSDFFPAAATKTPAVGSILIPLQLKARIKV